MSERFPLVPKELDEALAELAQDMRDLASGVGSDGAYIIEVRQMGGVVDGASRFAALVDYGTDVPILVPIAVKPAVSIDELVGRLCHPDRAPRTLH